jgi:hypothetical protein
MDEVLAVKERGVNPAGNERRLEIKILAETVT